MTAFLCRLFGLQHIEVAEDIASDTFLKASEHWAIQGIPRNPVAWLYTVAKNKARDYLRQISRHQQSAVGTLADVDEAVSNFEYNESTIQDSQLAMIFAVCNPVNSPESQICLALQILCGFSVDEIANAFLTNRETIKKRLQRARAHLRSNSFSLKELQPAHIRDRLDTVLKTIYLLFNEGYYSQSYKAAIRKDLCAEAMRLALFLTENKQTCTPAVNALLALMCYQSSRLEARLQHSDDLVLFEDQDKSLWDWQLIDRGNYYLVAATEGNEISKYHLEAGIAYWHTTDATDKWQKILELYDRLVIMENSPLILLSRAFTFSKVYGSNRAIEEVKKLNFDNFHYYHALLGYLYSDSNKEKAIAHYEQAIKLSKSSVARQQILKEVDKLKAILQGYSC